MVDDNSTLRYWDRHSHYGPPDLPPSRPEEILQLLFSAGRRFLDGNPESLNLDKRSERRWIWVCQKKFCLERFSADNGSSNQQFEETTGTDENAFIKDGQLYIKPTLQDESLITANSIIDLTNSGCTGTSWSDCVAVTNITNGTSKCHSHVFLLKVNMIQ